MHRVGAAFCFATFMVAAGCLASPGSAPSSPPAHALTPWPTPTNGSSLTGPAPGPSNPSSTSDHSQDKGSPAAPSPARPARPSRGLEPADDEGPTFATSPIALSKEAGEPSVAADPHGGLIVTGPACITSSDPDCLGQQVDAPVFESQDLGATWQGDDLAPLSKLVDRPEDGTHSSEAHVAVDDVGHRYVFDLRAHTADDATGTLTFSGGLFRSLGAGAPWELPPSGPLVSTDDRPWIAAEGDGHLLVTWNSDDLCLPLVESFDAGATWDSQRVCGYALPGAPVFDRLGRAFIPLWVAPQGSATAPVGFSPDAGIGVVHRDGSGNWSVFNTGVVVHRAVSEGDAFATNILPVAAVTDDGHVAVAWSQEDTDPSGLAVELGSSVWTVVSSDGGTTWGAPIKVSSRANAVLPWATGGGGDRLAFAYYSTTTAGPPGRAYDAVWDMMAAVVADAGSPAAQSVEVVAESAVHRGTICADNSECFASDRYSLLDFMTVTSLPTGQLVLAYTVDGPRSTEDDVYKAIGLLSHNGIFHVAVQSGGSPLFVPQASERIQP